MNLRENIKNCRKAMNFTQEQLAEVMGVTVGAVSKWESGASTPDLSTLMDLAELFQTSTDALLGFALQGAGAEEQAAAIRECTGNRAYEKGRIKAEKALQNFPNHFDVVYRSAVLYEMMGLDTGDGDAFYRAIDLYRRATGLLDQNRDPAVGLRTLYAQISECYHSLGEYEQALNILKEHNEGGIYDDRMSQLLMNLERWDEACQLASESVLESLTRLERSAMVLWNCLSEGKGEHREARELQAWLIALQEGLYTGESGYLHKLNAALYTGCAILSLELEEEGEAVACLRRAKAAAEAFDARPSYDIDGDRLRFYRGRQATAHDDFGQTAMEGIAQAIARQKEPVRTAAEALWARVRQAE